MVDLTYNQISVLENKYGTPFYLMYPETYRSNIKAFIYSFKKKYDRIIAGYSFKTNYVPALCLIAKNEGHYAEVVSEMEYTLAEKLGFTNIIFNGPIKKDNILYHAIESGSIINLDSEYEIESVCKYKEEHPDASIKVGLRINIMLTYANGQSSIQSGLRTGRFGFPYEILESNIVKLREHNIKINSIHGHTSSSDRIPLNYRVISTQMLHVCERFQLNDIEYFDIGGGYFGAAAEGFDTSGRPTYSDYADAILDIVLNNQWFNTVKPYIIIEPGASVVSNVFNYITKVHQTKKIGDVNFAIIDGSVFDVKPTMHSYNPPFKIYQKENNEEQVIYDVVGSTCMEKDVILKSVKSPKLANGDYIQLFGIGSYTISMTPIFINFLSPILCISEKVSVVRRRQNISDIMSIYETSNHEEA